MTDNLYKKLSQERKALQEQGHLPEWFTTSGYQLFLEKYNYGTKTRGSYLEQCQRIAKTAARHTTNPSLWYVRFFDILWKGWLSCSTPVLANMGTGRGLPVSCSGGHIPDSVDGFYASRREAALLTKYGFGTSGYLGEIRPRGSPFGKDLDSKSTGVLPVLKGFIQDSRDISQGSTRRGAWAGYLEVEHGDFFEVCNYLEAQPDDMNIGWIITDDFIKRLNASDEDAISRYQRFMKVKMVTGKGYFFFRDKVNRARPDWYKERDLYVQASNLCNEIRLPSSDTDTFTCVLSSLNLAYYDDWVGTDAVFVATVFLDCVAEEFIHRAAGINGLERAVGFTRRSRALGLGVCGLHTFYQQKMIPFGSMEAHLLNNSIFSYIREEAERATKWMWEEYHWNREIPEYCNGEERWNSHVLALPPTKSTALIMGGVSEGINPDFGMAFMQDTAGGQVERVNPTLLKLMKERGVYSKKVVKEIAEEYNGSVQHVDWLSDHEKDVFKTAFEIDQKAILRQAAARQRWIDQGQSLNLFFSADEDEAYISEVHKEAFENENIHGLYYVYSMAGVKAAKEECSACQ